MLDTNVVLDWLLFADSAVAPLVEAVTAGRVRWLATTAMRDEFAHVLDRGLAAAQRADSAALLAAWDAHVCQQAGTLPQALRCTDPDDQKFIDLALAAGARWLVSRDRAVLALARPAALAGLLITPPAQWRFAD